MNAFVLVDKKAGVSSFDVIRELRKLTGIRKIGHAGTLDPFATGLLICAIGQYTRLLSFAEARDKSYEATLVLGKKSSTGDPEGEITEQRDPDLSAIDPLVLRERALALHELPLPIYSAIKVNGKRAYQYARAGVELTLPVRGVEIHDFEVIGQQNESITYRVKVSKGTYIRSFSEWLAEQTGNVGMTLDLRRTAIGGLNVDSACPFEELAQWQRYICHPRQVLDGMQEYRVTPEQSSFLTNGRALIIDGLIDGQYAVYTTDDVLQAIAHAKSGELIPAHVFDTKDMEH